MRPLLSICIPTYNRCLWLRSSLWNWLPQVKQFQDNVELIVSDNASSDETIEIVEKAREWGPLQYHRNETNVGWLKNHVKATKLAQGEFIWILGDDNIPRSGTVQKVIEVLREYPLLKYIYVNSTQWKTAKPPIGEPVAADSFDIMPVANSNLRNFYADKIFTLIETDISCFTGLFSSIWHNTLAKDIFHNNMPKENTSLESALPHAVYIAEHMLKTPGYYIGHPYIINSWDGSWSACAPILILAWLPELFDKLMKNGVPRSLVANSQRWWLQYSADPLWVMLRRKDTAMRDKFYFWLFLKRHWRFIEFYKIILKLAKRTLISLSHKTLKLVGNIYLIGPLLKRFKSIWKRLTVAPLESLQNAPGLFQFYRYLNQHPDIERKPGGWFYKGNFYPDYLTVGGAGCVIFREALNLCKGYGVDVGAGFWPLPGAIAVDVACGPGAGKNISDFQDNSLDFVFSSHCLEHIGNWKSAIGEWLKKVKQSGTIFLYLPHPECAIWNTGSPFVGAEHKWIPTPEIIKGTLIEFKCDILQFDDGPDGMQSFWVAAKKNG